jgi:hypothetical protein
LRAGLAGRRTFAGCVFAPQRGGSGRVLVHREAAKMAAPVALEPGRDALWDNRFSLRLAGEGDDLLWGALGAEAAPAWRESAETRGIPRAVLPTLPAIMDKRGILAVPPLGWTRAETGLTIRRWGFTPVFPLAGAGFRLVTAPARII